MGEERTLYRYQTDRECAEKKGQEGNKASHEHLYRVAIGSPIIRWCERCGKSYLLLQHHEGAQNTVSYAWVAIQEQEVEQPRRKQ